jgi:dienelactone hydrolase
VNRDEFRQHLLDCLGGPFPEPCPLNARTLDTWQADGYRLESVSYESEPGDFVPACVLVPDGVSAEHPAPGVVCLHQHAGQYHIGKSEPAGVAGDPMHWTGKLLAQNGYVVLCADALGFEQRRGRRLQDASYERYLFMKYALHGKCLAWKNIVDIRRSVDYLTSRPEVKPGGVGAYGHSMGSTHSWLAGPWDDRLVALVGNCCLPTYHAILRDEIVHCYPNYIPGLLQYGDVPDILALIAPRAYLINAGTEDGGSPIDEVRRAYEHAKAAYEELGVGENLELHVEETGHVFSEGMRRKALEFFGEHLPVT